MATAGKKETKTPKTREIAPIHPVFFISFKLDPIAVATTAKSRNILLPKRANPERPATSEIPLVPPDHFPPKKARIRPHKMAMAAPGIFPFNNF